MGTHRLDFAEFYRQSKDACLFSVLVSVGDRDLAQDLVDEAFARAWASWRSVSSHPAPAAWVVRTALNANISRWRRRRREVPLPDPGVVANLAAEPVAADSSVDPRIMASLARLPRPGVHVRALERQGLTQRRDRGADSARDADRAPDPRRGGAGQAALTGRGDRADPPALRPRLRSETGRGIPAGRGRVPRTPGEARSVGCGARRRARAAPDAPRCGPGQRPEVAADFIDLKSSFTAGHSRQVAALAAGACPVLVFLHGVAMDGSVWAPVVADLRRDHRCVVPTLPLGAHRRPMRADADLSLRGVRPHDRRAGGAPRPR